MARQRRRYLLGICVLSLLAGTTAACGAPGAQASGSGTSTLVPQKPSSPITLTILDGGGDLGTNKTLIQDFVKANPSLVKSVQYESSAAPDADSKVQAQESSGHVSIGLMLGGTDLVGPLLQHKQLVKLAKYSSDLPDLSKIQDTPRQTMQALVNGYGVMDLYTPSGPMLSYNPSKVSNAPTTLTALMAWARAHPGKFSYADPANSGSGASFLMALPYMLGDSNPSDPVHGWTKTWAYLKELGKYINTYPESSTILNKQFGDGTLDMIPTIIAHDIFYRSDGTLPPSVAVSLFQDQQWVADAHYMMVPKGVSAQTLYVDLKLMNFILQPSEQVKTYITGIMTTAIAGTSASQADSAAQAFMNKWGRPDFYPKALATGTVHPPLSPTVEQEAFTMWAEQVGSHAG